MTQASTSQPEERKQLSAAREYRNDQIVVYWEPRLCVHSARCLDGLPQVFDNERRPWVDLTAASADQIAAVVTLCPTSALRFARLDGGAQEEGAEPTTIQARLNGPCGCAAGCNSSTRMAACASSPAPCSAAVATVPIAPSATTPTARSASTPPTKGDSQF